MKIDQRITYWHQAAKVFLPSSVFDGLLICSHIFRIHVRKTVGEPTVVLGTSADKKAKVDEFEIYIFSHPPPQKLHQKWIKTYQDISRHIKTH